MRDADGAGEPAPEAGLLGSELAVAHPRLLLGPTMERLPEATVHSTCGLDGRPATPVFVEIGGVDVARLERALSTDPTVTDCRCVAVGDRFRTYRVRVTADAVALSEPAAERGIQVRTATRHGAGWRLRLNAPDRASLSDFRQYCLARNVDVTVDRLCAVEEWSGCTVALADRHRETLRAALEEGYFEIPRRATQTDLAERLDVSGSAVSQRLRRATRELVSRQVDTADEPSAGTRQCVP